MTREKNMNKLLVLLLACFIFPLTSYSAIISTTFSGIEAAEGSTFFRIDDFLPNPGINNQVLGEVPENVFTDAGIGFVAEGLYADATSGAVTSDFIFGSSATHIWTFVNPENTNQKAGVQQLGFRMGSVADTVYAHFFDMNDNLLGTVNLHDGPMGFESDGEAIHKVTFSQAGTDTWLIGSFNHSTAYNDIVFSGFETIQEPQPYWLLLFGLILISVRPKIKSSFNWK